MFILQLNINMFILQLHILILYNNGILSAKYSLYHLLKNTKSRISNTLYMS